MERNMDVGTAFLTALVVWLAALVTPGPDCAAVVHAAAGGSRRTGLAVAGGVTAPGFYEVRPDAPVTDAVMRAGGLAAGGDATKLSIRRAGRTIIPESELRARVAMGSTLDDLNIRAGDELRVGEQRRRDWLEVARTLAYVAVVATGLWASGRF